MTAVAPPAALRAEVAALDALRAEVAALRAAQRRSEGRARAASGLAALSLGATLLLNVRPSAVAQTPGVSLAALVAGLNGLTATVAGLGNQVAALSGRLSGDETVLAAAASNVAPISRSGTDLYITGVNVHVIDGTGSTASTSGLGNLIVGYDRFGSGSGGSHNLVLGDFNTYRSYAGVVAGFQNSITAPYATVTGGLNNTASGNYASVSGGTLNMESNGVGWAAGFPNLGPAVSSTPFSPIPTGDFQGGFSTP